MRVPSQASTPLKLDDVSLAGAEGPRVLVFTTLFPNPAQPRLGVFVRERVLAVARHCPTQVVAPILSRLGGRHLDHGSAGSVPVREEIDGLTLHHPRFRTIPGVARAADAALLFWQSLRTVRGIRRQFAFDLIDAHYAFPDGAAAVLLGRHFGVPVCVTLRGGDIDLLPRFRMRRRIIQRTLQAAQRVFAVSAHLADGAATLGLPRQNVQVVPNGIDARKFFRIDRETARNRLGVACNETLLLCVGNLLAEKGQHVLIEALDELERSGGPAPRVVLIGSDQWGRHRYTRVIAARVQELGLGDRVTLLGSQPHETLAMWYNAADLLVLPTFREGCPNVVREALACGTPVVASKVGGVPELITSDSLGLLVEPGDASALARAIDAALRRRWDRDAIATLGGRRTWPIVAATIADEFRALVDRQGRLPNRVPSEEHGKTTDETSAGGRIPRHA
jgi:teichuronic acid biosynthesis glycosyltransferase TuaC